MNTSSRKSRAGRRRPKTFNALATLGATGHNGFERMAGVGVFLEPWLGRTGTNVLWSVVHPLSLWKAIKADEADEALLAFNAGAAIAGSAVHFIEWPWSLKFGFLPWLDEAEGMEPSRLPAYNTILWLWLIGGVGSALTETNRKDLKWLALGVATAPGLLASARHHFTWAREQAEAGDPHFADQFLKSNPRQNIGTKEKS